MRSPRRTAQTAAALMVGLALVSTIAVLGASLSKSGTSSIDNALTADYLITSGSVSSSVPAVVSRTPGVATVSTVYGPAPACALRRGRRCLWRRGRSGAWLQGVYLAVRATAAVTGRGQ
jgi:putative ABC transport system permease protein